MIVVCECVCVLCRCVCVCDCSLCVLCLCSPGSFSRTAVNADCGGRSCVAGVVAAFVVLLSLYVVTPALQYIPKAVLSAIVIVAIVNLIDFPRAVHFYKTQWRCVSLACVCVRLFGAAVVLFSLQSVSEWMSV